MRQTKIPNPEYRRAFINYLRYGTDIKVPYFFDDVETKSANKYIWRTERDMAVRVSHAENEGKIFEFESETLGPKKTPSKDFGCRCTLEDYIEGVSEYANQTIISEINDAALKWTNFAKTRDPLWDEDTDDFLDDALYKSSFVSHFEIGQGRNVTLREIGYLQDAINHYFYTLDKMKNVNDQIIEEARKCNEDSAFTYSFNGSYEFWSIKKPLQGLLFSFGSGVVGGNFEGTVKRDRGMMIIEGRIKYYYYDEFTDPFDLRQCIWPGTSSLEILEYILEIIYDFGVDIDQNSLDEKLEMFDKNIKESIKNAFNKLSWFFLGDKFKKKLKNLLKKANSKEEFMKRVIEYTDITGEAFKVTDNWETEFKAEAKIDRNNSIYIDNSKK